MVKGAWISSPYLKGSSPFIDRTGSANYGLVTLQLRLSYMASGAPGWICQFIELG
jgi:hypothetical protein